jgi:hypothetical protein
MARRATKTAGKRKTGKQKTAKAKKSTAKRKTSRKTAVKRAKPRKTAEMKAAEDTNRQALWHTYRDLQNRVNQALDKLSYHFQTRAAPEILIQDKQELLFLLGECNYMARTCEELELSGRKSR